MLRIQKTKKGTHAEMLERAHQRTAETKSARVKSAERKLAPLAKEINTRLEKAAQMDDKAFDHRLAAALRLADAQSKCKELGLTFNAWAEAHIDRNIDEVYRLAKIGGAPDPRVTLENLRSGEAARKRKARARQPAPAGHPAGDAAPATSTPAKSKFLVAEDALLALDDKSRMALTGKQASDAGMRLVPETTLKSLRAKEVDLEKLRARTTSLEFLKEGFARLGAVSKMEFVKWSAHEIGAKVEMPDFTRAPGEMPDIPAILDRCPKNPAPAKRVA